MTTDDPTVVLSVGGTWDLPAGGDGGIEVRTSVYASEARDALARGDVDCVVAARELPDTDGLGFLSDLRKSHPLVPVVVVGDRWDPEVARRTVRYGGTDYVVADGARDGGVAREDGVEGGAERGTAGGWRARLRRRVRVAARNYRRQRRLDVEDHRTRTERTRFQRLFEHSRDCIAFTEYLDGKPIVRQLNPAFEEVFGYSASAAIGENLNELIVPEDRRGSARSLDASALDEEWVEREVRRETADGERRDFLFRGTQVTTETGAIEGYPIYTDITERKDRERELERKNELLDEFAAVVSHDIDTPLGVIENSARLVEATGDPAHVEDIYAAADRVRELTDDLLSLAREGKRIDGTRPVDVASVARDAWAAVDPGAAALDVETPGTVEADPDRLRQLFENLFENSVEHGSTGPRSGTGDSVEHGSTGPRSGTTGDGVGGDRTGRRGDATGRDRREPPTRADGEGGGAGGAGTVTVRVGGFPGGFYVADDGPGIPAVNREAVLEQGFSTDPDGTGLGLAIVDRIARGHGWSVEVTDAEGGGARIEVHTRTRD